MVDLSVQMGIPGRAWWAKLTPRERADLIAWWEHQHELRTPPKKTKKPQMGKVPRRRKGK